jgi:hypothetical protein
VEIRGLAGDPAQEPRHRRMRAQRRRIAGARQLDIAEARVDRAVADRMKRHHRAAAAALGHRVVPFHAPAERPAAEPAGRPRRGRIGHTPDQIIAAH